MRSSLSSTVCAVSSFSSKRRSAATSSGNGSVSRNGLVSKTRWKVATWR
jgi:hypothetical protein